MGVAEVRCAQRDQGHGPPAEDASIVVEDEIARNQPAQAETDQDHVAGRGRILDVERQVLGSVGDRAVGSAAGVSDCGAGTEVEAVFA